jgi:uncharacterized membrane protein YgcG
MRRLSFILLILSVLVLSAHSQELVFPEKHDTVTDYTGEVDAEVKARIKDLADELRRITSVNLAVAVIRTTKPLDADSYSKELYDLWDVGRKEEGLDHGVLLLVAILDREVKIIAGRGVDFILTPKIREDMQWSLFPLLGEGEISQAVYVGGVAISQFIQMEWPKYRGPAKEIDVRTFSVVLFSLFAAAILLTLIFGGDFLTVFGTIVGGLFGFLLLEYVGLILGAAIGFLVNIWVPVSEAAREEKVRARIYKEWIKRRKEKHKHEGGRT